MLPNSYNLPCNVLGDERPNHPTTVRLAAAKRCRHKSTGIAMSVALPSSPVISPAMDAMLCPACGDHFRAPPAAAVPKSFGCSHTLCGVCTDEILQGDDPHCSVCAAKVDEMVANLGLAAYAEGLYLRSATLVARDSSTPALDTLPGPVPTDSATASEPTSSILGRPLPPVPESAETLPDVSSLCERLGIVAELCSVGADELIGASRTLQVTADKMARRLDASCSAFVDNVEALKAAIDLRRDEILASAKRLCDERIKALTAQQDALVVSACQLRACVAMCHAAAQSNQRGVMAVALDSGARIATLANSYTGPCVSTLLEVNFNTGLHPLLDALSVLRDGIDWRHCSMTGPGSRSFVQADESPAQNGVVLECKTAEGYAMTTLAASDVYARVRPVGPSGLGNFPHARVAVTDVSNGVVNLSYAVTSPCVQRIELLVNISGQTLRRQLSCGFQADGAQVHTIALAEPPPAKNNVIGNNGVGVVAGSWGDPHHHSHAHQRSGSFGNSVSPVSPHNKLAAGACIDVSHDGTLLLVSDAPSCRVVVYDSGTGDVIHAFGGMGTQPGTFCHPVKLCCTPHDTVLVAEDCNRRVQEVTLVGGAIRFIGFGTFTDPVLALAHCDGVIAVLTAHNSTPLKEGAAQVTLFDYSSGAAAHVISSPALAVPRGLTKRLLHYSLRFCRGSGQLLIADACGNRVVRMTLPSTNDQHDSVSGELGVAVPAKPAATVATVICGSNVVHSPADVLATTGGRLVVADCEHNRIALVSESTGRVQGSWATGSLPDDKIDSPVSMAVHGSLLYVLESTKRVRVFE